MKGSLVIIAFFILGTVCGLLHLVPSQLTQGNTSYFALCALIFCVGISIGNDSSVLQTLRHTNPRLLLLPLCTFIGTMAGCLAVSLLTSTHRLTDCLAIGPQQNQINNIGLMADSTHFSAELKTTPHRIRRMFTMQRH